MRIIISPETASCDGSPDDRLTAAVKEYFKLESIGISTSTNSLQSKDNERALAILERETKLIDGRYETGLIWRRDDPDEGKAIKRAQHKICAHFKPLAES